MDIKIRQYKESDWHEVVGLMNKLQDFLINLDPLNIIRRMDGYGESYTKRFLEKVEKNKGAIYIAEIDGCIIGLIGGIIEKQTEEDLLEFAPVKSGRVLEVIVDEKFRGKNIGSLLMKKMEGYFKENNCDIARVEVFNQNHSAHNFYKKFGYEDRMIDAMKKL